MRRVRRAPTPGDGSSAVCAREDDRGSGQHDPVRDDPALEIGHRDGDERGAEERGDRCIRRQPEGEHAGADRSAVHELDERVLPGDRRAAAAAAAAEQQLREDRDVVVPRDAAWRTTCTPRAGCTTERRSGTRAATTFRKLPSARPGTNASAARAALTTYLLSAVRDRPLEGCRPRFISRGVLRRTMSSLSVYRCFASAGVTSTGRSTLSVPRRPPARRRCRP